MLNKTNFIYKDQVETLCNVMINAQQLLEDLELLESEGLFQQQLKNQTKRFLETLEKCLNQIYGVEYKKVSDAIKEGKSEKEIENLKKECNISNLDIVNVYEKVIKSRRSFDSLDFKEKLILADIIHEIRNSDSES